MTGALSPTPAPVEHTSRSQVRAAMPTLSVLTPVFRHDPSPIIDAFAKSPRSALSRMELTLLDDGSGDYPALKRLEQSLAQAPFDASLIAWSPNQGRAKARNRLVSTARARHVLFLDADMIPDDAGFIGRWLALIDEKDPAAAFGGFSVAQAPVNRATALHKFMSARSDCKPASARQADAAQFTATSNLLVRKDVLAATPFDESFVGWGWEDVDWALRASRFGAINHIDNPATHAGLDDVPTLLRKFQQGGPNYARLAAKHPEAVQNFASWKVTRVLKALPGHALARPALAWLARDPLGIVPMLARHAALKLYRTSIYAEHAP
jgi:glycosyltransferase involved in cell wall biosynthesis